MGFNGIKLYKILFVTFIICDITVKEIILWIFDKRNLFCFS